MSGLSKAYQEVINNMDKKITDAVKDDGQEKVFVQYSAYLFDEYDIPIDNLDEVPEKGMVRFIDGGDKFGWKHDMDGTENPYNPFESVIMDSPTWLEIAVEANRMINTTYNSNHCYLEDIEWVKDDDIMIFRFIMGS